jgi:hypothetical protein
MLAMEHESAHILGIYNYCDRWCERCAFTSRCRAYATETEAGVDPAASDVRNAAFWEGLGRSLLKAQQMLTEMARERGIDLDAIMAAGEGVAEPPAVDEARRALCEEACAYSDRVDEWFEAAGPLLKEKGRDLASAARMGLPGVDSLTEADAIHDAVEVIRWYSSLVAAKLARGAQMHAEVEDDPELTRIGREDADGSAKVALVGMDRSIAAWNRLYDSLASGQDGILDVLVQLARVRRATEQLFPNARAFVRPGFAPGVLRCQ